MRWAWRRAARACRWTARPTGAARSSGARTPTGGDRWIRAPHRHGAARAKLRIRPEGEGQAMASTCRQAMRSIALAAVLASLAACQGDVATLAFDRPDMQAADAGALALQSPVFADGRQIPGRYSAYGDDVSLPLAWQAVPGAKSYALVMEDPDADRPAPYVHWVAWNIPAGVTALPEGLSTDPRLDDPDGMRQGLNDRGAAGYFGPRPPAGSGVHHYHV